MATVSRDANTCELVIRLMESQLNIDAREIVARIEDEIMKFLVKEFTDKHGQNILNAVHDTRISEGIAQQISDNIQKQFFKGKPE